MFSRPKGDEGHRRPIDTIRPVLIGLSLLLLPRVASSQVTNVQTYTVPNGDNVKNYATEYAPQSGNTVMVGTAYTDPSGSGSKPMIHFIVNDVNSNNLYSVLYDDPNYAEEYGVDIDHIGNDEFLITALARPNAGLAGYTSDMIKILNVDINGTIINEWDLNGYVSDPSRLTNLYPIHAIYYNNFLYVCGYTSDDNGITAPNAPSYNVKKEAFVMKFDHTVPSCTARVFDYVNSTNIQKDYDIAMRLIPLGSGDIFVTGSMTSEITGPALKSGVMSRVVDGTWLTPTTIGDNSYELLTDAYGIDLIEKTNEQIIIGNFFYDAGGPQYDPLPEFFWFNQVAANFAPITTVPSCLWFAGFDYAWGLQILSTNSVGSGYTNFVLAGMQSNMPGGCSMSPAPGLDNINPFITYMGIAWNNLTGISPNTGISANGIYTWRTYLNQTGTADPALYGNSYPRLFGFISNMAWSPTFATYDAGNPGYNLSAPKYDPGTKSLGLKYIQANGAPLYDVPGCTGSSDESCSSSVSFHTDYASAPTYDYIDDNQYNTNIVQNTNSNSYNYVTPTICSGTGGTGNFRTTPTITNVPDVADMKLGIYPNPAKGHIEVALKGSYEPSTYIELKLANLIGQDIAVLYKGNAADLVANKKLELPDVASGIYLVQVYVNKQMISLQKLSIQ